MERRRDVNGVGGGWRDGRRRETVGERRGRGKVSGGDGRDDGRAATNACTVVFLGGRRTANDATPRSCQNSQQNSGKIDDGNPVVDNPSRRVARLLFRSDGQVKPPCAADLLTWWRDKPVNTTVQRRDAENEHRRRPRRFDLWKTRIG